MRKLLFIAFLFQMAILEARVGLDRLIESNKSECIEKLKIASDAELWSVFLENQTELFFRHEFSKLKTGQWWNKAQHILEIGSGDGSYLNRLSEKFPDKTFMGIELLSKAVQDSNLKYAKEGLQYEEGNAEIYNPKLKSAADLVLFRVTLQHLKDPILALSHAFDYLSPGGYVLIIESFDEARQTSHPTPTVENALSLIAETQKTKGKGNRKISFDIFKSIQDGDSQLSELYDVAYSNLDLKGKVVGDVVLFEGEGDRGQFSNLGMLFVELLHRTYQIPVDLDNAFDEFQAYLKDKAAWTAPGVHFLVLKKK